MSLCSSSTLPALIPSGPLHSQRRQALPLCQVRILAVWTYWKIVKMPPHSSPLSAISRSDFRDISDLITPNAIPKILHRRSPVPSTTPDHPHGQQPALAALQPLDSFSSLSKRQQQQQRLVFIPDFYRDTRSSPAPAVVAGATLGAVIRFFIFGLAGLVHNELKKIRCDSGQRVRSG